jgi:hypothetical protein
MVVILTILLCVLVPLSFLAGGFLAYKGVQLGLRWQIQTKHEEKPSMDVHNPITTVVNTIKEKQEDKENTNILNEWLNGPAESR